MRDRRQAGEATVKYWEPENVARRLNREAGHGRMSPFGVVTLSALCALSAGTAASGMLAIAATVMGAAVLMYALGGRLFPSVSSEQSAAGLFESWTYSPSKGTLLTGLARTETVYCDYVVNAAGCKSDRIAKMVGDHSFKVKPRMGEYILLHKNEGVRLNTSHTLFPCPHPVYGKGVLVQGTLWGNLILGPTARDTMKKNKATGEYEIDPDVRDEPRDNIMGYILSKCRNLIPDFDASQVIHTFSGARAKNTWEIDYWSCQGVDGFINAAA